MGLVRLFSSSVYDRKEPDAFFLSGVLPPNPNPARFELLDSHQEGNLLLVKVHYPDCTNYEGNKVMLYEGITTRDLLKQGTIDPHFSASPAFHSPIARFEPTTRGWQMACLLMKQLNGCKK